MAQTHNSGHILVFHSNYTGCYCTCVSHGNQAICYHAWLHPTIEHSLPTIHWVGMCYRLANWDWFWDCNELKTSYIFYGGGNRWMKQHMRLSSHPLCYLCQQIHCSESIAKLARIPSGSQNNLCWLRGDYQCHEHRWAHLLTWSIYLVTMPKFIIQTKCQNRRTHDTIYSLAGDRTKRA